MSNTTVADRGPAQTTRGEIPDQGRCNENGGTGGKPRNSSRQKRRYAERPTVFTTGQNIAAAAQLGERVYLIGKAPNAATLLAAVEPLPHCRVYLADHHPVITYKDADERTHTVTWAGSWFGDDDYSATDAEVVWHDLNAAIRDEWHDDSATLLFTPATTGRDLWTRTIRPAGWPVLNHVDQSFIRSTAGQGRIETAPRRAELIPQLYEYDARLAYLAVTRNLPVGPPMMLENGAAETFADENPYKPARYLVSFSVPRSWHHLGILPTPIGNDERLSWSWPTEQGRTHGPVWVDAVELFVARKWDWSVRIHKACAWVQTGDPLRTWQDRLARILERGPAEGVRASMWRHAVRAIVLHGIGAMHGSPRKLTHVGDGTAIPAGAKDVRELRYGRTTWKTLAAPAWPELCHPEWTATIWSRARARLLDAPGETGALHLPGNTVVALRTDAIYSTQYAEWPDDGKVGRYVLKGVYPGGPWPRSGTDLLRMKRAAA